jgi:hypothetical protein
MMGPLPFDAATPFRWRLDGAEVAACAIGGFQTRLGARAVLKDTADRHWLAEIDADGRLREIMAGPLTAAQAVQTAESICAGIHDHGSVAGLVNTLALAVLVVS